MRTVTAAALCVLLAGPVYAQSLGERTGVNAMLGITPSTADFVKEAASSDMLEIQSSQLAVERGDAAIKAFATQMIADHQKTSGELKGMVQGGTVQAEIPNEMLPSHQKMLDGLKDKNGADFVKAYNDVQVAAHKEAVNLYQRYSKGGDNEALKTWAGKTLPSLEHHHHMAQELDKQTEKKS